MNARTVLQIGMSLALAAVVSGIGIGFAQGMGGESGIEGMWAAGFIAWLAAAAAIFFVGVLRDVGGRPPHAPPAVLWAFVVAGFLIVCASILLFLVDPVPTKQLATWVTINGLCQFGLLFVLFRKGAGATDR